MKTINSVSIIGFAKKALILGIASVLLVSCGKSNKNEVPAATSTGFNNQFNHGNFGGNGNGGFAGGGNCADPIQRAFNYSNGTLQEAGLNGSTVFASYIGYDITTGDSATIRDHGSNNIQLVLVLCKTGNQQIDNLLASSVPTFSSSMTYDANVPDPAQCPGRINSGNLYFGQVGFGQPIFSSFSAPQQCL
jgi:hypothetical protein